MVKLPTSVMTGLAALPLIISGCGGSSSSSSSDTGTLSIGVTDAPVDSAAAVVVSFTGIAIKPADGDEIEFTFDEARSIDLLALQGSNSASLIENEVVPAGEYNWMRLMVNASNDGTLDSYLENTDGSTVELYVPSGSQTGLKLVSGFTVLAGGSADFTIDFDLRKSLTDPTGQTAIKLKPALRVIDNAEYGTITGTIAGEMIAAQCADASLDDGAVYVFSGADVTPADVSGAESDPLTTALVSYDAESGAYSYELGFMPVDSYTLSYTCDTASDDPEAVDELSFTGTASVVVTAGATTTYDFAVAAPQEPAAQ